MRVAGYGLWELRVTDCGLILFLIVKGFNNRKQSINPQLVTRNP